MKSENLNAGWDFSRCAAVLREEIDLIKRIVLVQEEGREALRMREWGRFAEYQREAEALGAALADLDAERSGLFAALAGSRESGVGSRESGNAAHLSFEASIPDSRFPTPDFYTLTSNLPETERLALGKLFREMQLAALRMKDAARGFADYLGEMKSVTIAFLGAAFPGREAKLYSRKGTAAREDLRSLVINHEA